MSSAGYLWSYSIWKLDGIQKIKPELWTINYVVMKTVRGRTFVRQFWSVCVCVCVCCLLRVSGGDTLLVRRILFWIVFVRLLKIKLPRNIFSNLNPTSRKIRLSISKTKRIILYRDMIYVYSENRVELKNVECWGNVEAIYGGCSESNAPHSHVREDMATRTRNELVQGRHACPCFALA
jgi:hypothetical protein